jgi:hypothetical protein
MRKTYVTLLNRFGRRNTHILGGVALFLTMALIAGTWWWSDQAVKVSSTRASAEGLLKQGDWLAARIMIDELKAEVPSFVIQQSTDYLTQRIDAIEISNNSFKIARSLQGEKKYLDSISTYTKVLPADIKNYKISLEEIKKLKLLAINDSIKRADWLFSKDRVQEAFWIIERTLLLAGPDNRLSSDLKKYKNSLDDRSREQQAQEEELLQAEVEKAEQELKAIWSKMRKKYDSFESVTWYNALSSPIYTNQNGFYLYFGVKDGRLLTLRLKMTYLDDDWLFVDTARVNVDGFIYPLTCSNWERDNKSGQIWEWCDTPLDDDREIVEAIIKSKKSVIRFEGDKYYDNRTISSSQKQALQDVLNAYDSY